MLLNAPPSTGYRVLSCCLLTFTAYYIVRHLSVSDTETNPGIFVIKNWCSLTGQNGIEITSSLQRSCLNFYMGAHTSNKPRLSKNKQKKKKEQEKKNVMKQNSKYGEKVKSHNIPMTSIETYVCNYCKYIFTGRLSVLILFLCQP